MAKYKMTWRKEQGGRWRKKYKHKAYYFRRRDGETKPESYARCWAEWLKKKAQIDLGEQELEPWAKGLKNLVSKTKRKLSQIQLDDTPENRRAWSFWHSMLDNYAWMLENGVDPFLDTDDVDDPPFIIGSTLRYDEPDKPPWEVVEQPLVPTETLDGNVKRFLARKEAQANRGERSVGRFESLRVGLEMFVEQIGGNRPIETVTTSVLSRFRDELERLVAEGKLSPHTARDRLQAVKQFVRWAWEEELINLPRILQSRDFTISIPETKIEIFTNAEIHTLLAASSETTRLYLLLMLNCGLQQGDISELRQEEVDWDTGRIIRKRSKTRKNGNGKNVPCVSYRLWPETFELLKKHRSSNSDLALTNSNGEPLKVETIVNGRANKKDNIRSAYRRVVSKIANDKNGSLIIGKPMKLLRKTAASKLGSHPEYSRFAQNFLGHAPSTIADKHYIQPSEKQFDAAVEWLGAQFLDR